MKKLHKVLKESELDLIRETEPARTAELDEDALIDLHSRIRRARTKYVKNYRRQAAAGVAEHGGRGKSRPKNTKAAQKAEIFEDALARVSAELAEHARRAAKALKAERLAAARAGRSTGPDTAADAVTGDGPGLARAHEKTTGGVKRDASSRATGARRQAARDAR